MAHPGFLDFFSNCHSASKLIDAISRKRTPAILTGAGGYARTVYSASIYQKLRRPMVLIYSNPEEAVTSRRDLGDLLGHERVLLFPAREVMPFEATDNQESLWMRVSCLSKLLSDENQPLALVMPATGLARKLMPKEQFRKGCLCLRVGSRLLPDGLIRNLVQFGYERVSSVEHKGEAALRGGILDVFPPVAEYPYRIEFFDDEVDSIRAFDPETQVSSKIIDEAFLAPAMDGLFDDSENPGHTGATVFDYFSEPPIVLVDEYDKCLEAVQEFERVGLEIASARMIAGTMQSQEASVYFPASLAESYLSGSSLVFTSFPREFPGLNPKEIVESDTAMQVGFSGRWQEMIPELKQLVSEKKRVVILAGNSERRDVLSRWLQKEEVWISNE